MLDLGDQVEVCSGRTERGWALQVRFDRRAARDRCRELSAEAWEALRGLGEHDGRVVEEMERDDPVFVCLWPPLPLETPAIQVDSLAGADGDGFETVIHLPLADVDKVEEQMADLRPEMLTLLGHVSSVRYEGPGAVTPRTLEAVPGVRRELGPELHVQDFELDDQTWRVFGRDLEGGDLRIGVPLGSGAAGQALHLYFPTLIASGTPLLIHGPFRVDASRKHFSDAFREDNQEVVQALLEFWSKDVLPRLFLKDGPAEGVSSVALLSAFAMAGPAAAGLPQQLADGLLKGLLDCPCVPIRGGRHAIPADVLVSVPEGFDAAFDSKLLDPLGRPEGLDEGTRDWLRPHGRRLDEVSLAGLMARGARAAKDANWFADLLRLFDGWRSWTGSGLAELRTALGAEPILPTRVAGAEGRFTLAPLTDSPPIYFRATAGEGLAVPSCLGFSLLDPGVLRGDRPGTLDPQLKAIAEGHLGLRELSTSSVVVDVTRAHLGDEFAPEVLSFVGALIAQSTRGLGLAQVDLGSVGTSHHGVRWQLDTGNSSVNADERRQRRALVSIRLPCRDGRWLPGDEVLIGSDWGPDGELLEELYRHQPSAAWLAPPSVLLGHVPALDSHEAALRLALRLGAWRAPPVDSVVAHDKELSLRGFEEAWISALKESDHLQFDGYAVPMERVSVRVDHDLRHPELLDVESASDLLARLLGKHWRSFYGQLLNSVLACWSPSGRRRKYPALHPSAPSSLRWRLSTSAWFPVNWDGMGGRSPVPPTRVWLGTNVKRAGLPPAASRYQFVAITDRDHEGELLEDLGAIQAGEPTHEAARAELCRLQQLLVSQGGGRGVTGSEEEGALPIRQSSPRERALGTLCGDLLEAVGSSPGSIEDTPVLARQDGRVCFVSTQSEEVFYVGDAPQRDQQPFQHLLRAILPRDRKALAERLGLRPFRVLWTPKYEGEPRPDTERVRAALRDRYRYLVALRLFWLPPGVPAFAPDSREQQQRLDDLLTLEFWSVDELEVRAHIEGTSHQADPEGKRRLDVLYVAEENAVYHDYPEGDLLQLLPALAPSLAAVFASAHYEDAFARLLAAGEDEAASLCIEKGIGPDPLDEAEDLVRARGVEVKSVRDRLEAAFASVDLVGTFVDAALADPDWVRKVGPDSLLARLEAAGAELASLSHALEANGLERIDVRQHQLRFLRRSRRLGSRAVPFLAERDSRAAELIQQELDSVQPPALGLRGHVPDEELLDPLVGWLETNGLPQLVVPLLEGRLDPVTVAAALGVAEERLAQLESLAWSAEVRAQRAEERRRRLLDWVILDLVTAWLQAQAAHPLPSRVRSLKAEFVGHIGEATKSSVSDADLPTTVSERMIEWLGAGTTRVAVEARLAGQAPPETLVPQRLRAEVEAALARDVRQRAARIRDHMRQRLEERTPQPPPQESVPGAGGARKKASKAQHGKKNVGGKFSGPSGRELKRRGDRGEQVVLANQIKRLLALQPEAFDAALTKIDEVLQASFEGEAVRGRAAALAIARDLEATQDERIDALATYLLVAPWPGFGFDLLGWDPEAALPLFIEVKTTRSEGRFVWSEPEHRFAIREREAGGRYRIALVFGATLTWLTDPVVQVSLTEKDWHAEVA